MGLGEHHHTVTGDSSVPPQALVLAEVCRARSAFGLTRYCCSDIPTTLHDFSN